MNYIDIIIILPLIYALYRGWTEGLIIEISKLAALLLGIFIAANYSNYVKNIISNNLDIHSDYMGYIAFIVTFIAVVTIVILIGKIISKFIHAIALGFLNRLLGAIFSLIKTTIIICVIITIFEGLDNKVGITKSKDKKESKMYYPLYKFAKGLYNGFNLTELTNEIKSRTDKI